MDLVFHILLVVVFLLIIIYPLAKRQIKTFVYLKQKLYFGVVIRFVLETYLEFLLAAMTNVKQPNFTKSGEIISAILSFLIVILLTILPGLVHFKLMSKFNILSSVNIKQKWESMYEGLKVENKRAVLFNFYFLLRRMLYVYALSFFSECRVAQLAVINMGSLVIFSYLAAVKPFKTQFLNTLELLNEAFILLLSYFCFIFTDFQGDNALKFELGWAYSLLMVTLVLLNIFAILFATSKQLYKKCCRRKKSRNRDQQEQRMRDKTSTTEVSMLHSHTGIFLFEGERVFKYKKKKKSKKKSTQYQVQKSILMNKKPKIEPNQSNNQNNVDKLQSRKSTNLVNKDLKLFQNQFRDKRRFTKQVPISIVQQEQAEGPEKVILSGINKKSENPAKKKPSLKKPTVMKPKILKSNEKEDISFQSKLSRGAK